MTQKFATQINNLGTKFFSLDTRTCGRFLLKLIKNQIWVRLFEIMDHRGWVVLLGNITKCDHNSFNVIFIRKDSNQREAPG